MHLHRHGCRGLNYALLCCWCLFTVRANTAPCQEVLLPSFPVLLPLFSQEGGTVACKGIRPHVAYVSAHSAVLRLWHALRHAIWVIFVEQGKLYPL